MQISAHHLGLLRCCSRRMLARRGRKTLARSVAKCASLHGSWRDAVPNGARIPHGKVKMCAEHESKTSGQEAQHDIRTRWTAINDQRALMLALVERYRWSFRDVLVKMSSITADDRDAWIQARRGAVKAVARIQDRGLQDLSELGRCIEALMAANLAQANGMMSEMDERHDETHLAVLEHVHDVLRREQRREVSAFTCQVAADIDDAASRARHELRCLRMSEGSN